MNRLGGVVHWRTRKFIADEPTRRFGSWEDAVARWQRTDWAAWFIGAHHGSLSMNWLGGLVHWDTPGRIGNEPVGRLGLLVNTLVHCQ